MSIHCFTIPALHPEPAQGELNTFLAQRRVVSLQRAFVADATNPLWTFCVEVADAQAPLPAALRVNGRSEGPTSRGRADVVDYRQVFNDADFALYATLRSLRKQLSLAAGLPLYAVFSNDQLADMVRQRVHTLVDLAAVAGVGPARLDQYGAAVLACLQAQRALQGGTPPAATD